MKVKAFKIKYDTDGKKVVGLPKEIIFDVPDDMDVESEIADLVSDKTGWCIFSVAYEILKEYTFSSGSSECLVMASDEISARKKLSDTLVHAEFSRRFANAESKRAKIISVK